MPHIVVKDWKKFETPKEVGEFRFLWFATSKSDTLVAAEYETREFLIEIKPKEDRFIIKPDKLTRLSPTILAKEALVSFCQAADCKRVYDNLSTIKPTHAKRAKEFLKDIDFFLRSFPKQKEVWIEIGFGSGRHLLYQAKSHPDIQFIGIEIHKPSIDQLLGQIRLQGLENILVIDYDARLFLEFVPSNIVGKIFLHFPVPWDKKPHRRVISSKFIQEAKRVLKPQGILELRTDSKNYFDYAFDLLMQEPKVKLEITKNIEPPVSSKYEDRWVRLGKDIYDIRMVGLEESEPIDLSFDFSFQKLRFSEKILKGFSTKPIIYQNYFIHLEKLYTISPQKVLLRLSFGSFDRPAHTYIFIEPEGARYFGKKPVPSRANIQAHKKIEELLYG